MPSADARAARVLAPSSSWLALLLSVLVLGVDVGPADAAPANKVCRQCRTLCQESLAACIESDPRLASCPTRRRNFCLRRAKRDCKRNLKTCCRKTCRETGLLVCCGSAVSSTPGSGGGVTTTLPGVTTTTVGGTTTTTTIVGACTTDDDCPTCQCCNLITRVCSGTSGALQCCNIAGLPPTTLMPACGPKTPNPCPAAATCPPPGQLLGGTYYFCAYCEGSNNIVEVFVPSGSIPPISNPTNACMRR
jgi:hypothetical protein